MRIINFLTLGRSLDGTTQLYSIASVCNHSCVPNTYAAYRAGQLKFIVLRPIARNEHISISYGTCYGEHSDSERKQMAELMHFVCDRSKIKA